MQAQIDAALSLGINVLAYATNRELRTKEGFFANQPNARGPIDRVERGRLYVAKLRHPGGCDAAPRALVNLMDAAGRELKIRVDVHAGTARHHRPAAVRLSPGLHARANDFHLTDRSGGN